MPLSEAQLIEAAKRGDNSAFEQLYQLHAKLLYGYLYRRIGSRTDAEDICQETFVKAYRKLDQYRGDASFKNWVFQIAKHLIADHWRDHAKCRTLPIDDFFDLGHEPLSPEAEAEEARGQDRVAKQLQFVLDQLPSDYRRILELRFLHGYSIREAAEQLKISESNAKVRQYRAIKKAQSLLTNDDQTAV